MRCTNRSILLGDRSRNAKKHLTEKARDAIAELLDPGETIADASTWADEHRTQLPKTAPWHYVDVPLDQPAYGSRWSADDPKHGCVVDKINEFKATPGSGWRWCSTRCSGLNSSRCRRNGVGWPLRRQKVAPALHADSDLYDIVDCIAWRLETSRFRAQSPWIVPSDLDITLAEWLPELRSPQVDGLPGDRIHLTSLHAPRSTSRDG